jgi:hypothetical protein
MVNRVWHWLFSQGLVPSVDNFGKLGALPTHPELLDVLAYEFIHDGWSLKRLIRRMLVSRAWQTSSEPSVAADERDPGNRYLQHSTVRRLEAEEIRDSLLVVAGNLDPDGRWHAGSRTLSGLGGYLPAPERTDRRAWPAQPLSGDATQFPERIPARIRSAQPRP